MSSGKISVYSLADLKNTTDDALPNYLNSLHFQQSHRLTDVRLVLGYSAVAIAGALFYADWKLGWDVTKPYTLPAVLVYMVLNAAFTWWMWGVEKGVVYVGEKKGVKLEISTSAEKFDPTYHLTARYSTDAPAYQNWTTLKLSAPFSRWFSKDGFFVARPFQHFLASNIKPVGEADPKNLVAPKEQGAPTGGNGGKVENMDVRLDDLSGVLDHIKQSGGKVRRRG